MPVHPGCAQAVRRFPLSGLEADSEPERLQLGQARRRVRVTPVKPHLCWNRWGRTRRAATDVAVTVNDRASTASLRTGGHENPRFSCLDIRHRKAAPKYYPIAVSAPVGAADGQLKLRRAARKCQLTAAWVPDAERSQLSSRSSIARRQPVIATVTN